MIIHGKVSSVSAFFNYSDTIYILYVKGYFILVFKIIMVSIGCILFLHASAVVL